MNQFKTKNKSKKNDVSSYEELPSDLKKIPHSIEAEQAILGSLMIENAHWDDVSELLIARDFYLRSHQLIFTEMFGIKIQNPLDTIDIITVSEALENKNILNEVGGFAYLAELTAKTPSIINAKAYANIVHEKSLLRKLISVSNQIADECYSTNNKKVSDILDSAESKIFSINENASQKNEGPQSVVTILASTIEKLETITKNAQNNNGVTGLSTGFVDLDKKTTGLQNSDLIIIAARPSMGKTTFAVNICENIALAQDKPVLIFSLEMPANQLMIRILSSLSRVEQNKIRTGRLDDSDWASISSSFGLLSNKKNIYIDDSSSLTPMELRAKARRLHSECRAQGGLSMIMVDYLQLMRVPELSESRHLEIGEISRSLKALAKELDIPVVVLSQLNRGLEQRSEKRPINSDLRESGSIEQDADVIMFIYRDEVYNENSAEKGIAEIILGKQRNGPIGKTKLKFNGQWSRFDNLANNEMFDD